MRKVTSIFFFFIFFNLSAQQQDFNKLNNFLVMYINLSKAMGVNLDYVYSQKNKNRICE